MLKLTGVCVAAVVSASQGRFRQLSTHQWSPACCRKLRFVKQAVQCSTDDLVCVCPQVDNIPIWSPERGQVGERIFRDADDERETKEISIEDTAYWFSENNGEAQHQAQGAHNLQLSSRAVSWGQPAGAASAERR